MNRLSTVIIILLGFSGISSFSQKTTVYTEADAEFKTAIELFQKEKFGAAQNQFSKIISSHTDPNTLVRIDADYYYAICAMELFHKDGELLLKNFIANHPESPRAKTAFFYLGKYNYRKKQYPKALDWFAKIDIYDLDVKSRYEYYFKRGYSYFDQGQLDKAKTDFFEIKDIDHKYAAPANYYFSHIAYIEKNYESALQGFLKLVNNDDFGAIVPYYIVQIYYLRDNFNTVISFGTPLLDSANVKRAPEIARIIGESYYKTNRYKEAIPYFKKYERSVINLSREDNYELAYAYYMNDEIDNAATYFQMATSGKEDDLISQNAYYHLADCYLKQGKKKFARSAFYAAAHLDFDKQIKEDALFSYAKLSYELAFDPYNETIDAFKTYIREYPNSINTDKAYAYLINTYLTTKNYGEAIKSLEEITVMNDEVKNAYQKISYYRAIDFFNNNQNDSAIKYFDKALTYKIDKKINALAYYWKAESFYKKKQYDLAIYNYKEFFSSPGAFDMKEYNDANYNTAYCFFQMQDYGSANLWFRKFTGAKTQVDSKKLSDGHTRTGDTYFMMKQYDEAALSYEEAVKLNQFDVDYALYQKSLALGIQRKTDSKISSLQTLLVNYPKSAYAAPAKYELARTYLLMEQPDDALLYFKKLLDEYPNSTYVNKALIEIGQIYFNKKEDNKAFSYFDQVVKKDNKSPEAFEALNNIRNIFIAQGNVEGLKKYFDEAKASIASNSLDSIAFTIAKKYYGQKDCENASKELIKYMKDFPNGIFIVDATYYTADCEFKAGYADAALAGFNSIIQRPKNIYTEQSLVYASEINFKNKKHKEALENFTKLEEVAEYPKNTMNARIGQMRCHFLLKNYAESIAAANKVTGTEKVSTDLLDEARTITAKSYLETEKYDEAFTEFQTLASSSKSEKAAEAWYNMAYIQFLKNEFKVAEKTIFELINLEPSYPYWMTKGLILLSDCYMERDDYFQAKHTLKSVIENTDNAELEKLAQQKLERISEKEKLQVPQLSKENMQIEFKQNKLEYNPLFNEPLVDEKIQ